MRNYRILLFGHSYIRDLQSLGNKEIIVDNKFTIELSYLFKPGGTVAHYNSNKGLLDPLIASSPDVLFIFLGGNDLRTNWNIHDTIFNYKALVSYLASKLPNVPIICAYIEPRFALPDGYFRTPDQAVYKAYARKFNNWLQRWDVPYRKFMTWGSNRLENKDLFKHDGVHLNSQGISLLWELLEDLFIKVVESYFSS